jgi:hypothetical protein
MALVGIFCVVLLVLTTLTHYEVLRMLTVGLPTLDMPARAKLIVVIFGAFFAHVAEIFLYAVAFYVLVRYLGAGPLGHSTPSSLTLCMYFSAETYTSLELRMLAGMEALNGLLLIGWSASYTYIAMERFWSDDGKGNTAAVAQLDASADAAHAPRR